MIAGEWQTIVRELGLSVREVRRLIGWSQQMLADRAVTSQGTISRLESGDHPDVPFHSVVIVLRTLAAAAGGLELAMAPLTRALLTFTSTIAPSTVAVIAPDPDLAAIVGTFTGLSPGQRPIFLRFIRSAAELAALSSEAP